MPTNFTNESSSVGPLYVKTKNKKTSRPYKKNKNKKHCDKVVVGPKKKKKKKKKNAKKYII